MAHSAKFRESADVMSVMCSSIGDGVPDSTLLFCHIIYVIKKNCTSCEVKSHRFPSSTTPSSIFHTAQYRTLLEHVDNASVSLLGLEAAVEEERVLTGPPGLGVGDACETVSTNVYLCDCRAYDLPQAVMPTQFSRSKQAWVTAS